MSKLSAPSAWWLRIGTPTEGFRYLGASGRPLTSASVIRRIEALVIPPAWMGVHISPDPTRKVQAWGYDGAGRRQYIYSHGHVEARDQRKWHRVLHVARALPGLRATTNEHLQRSSIDREKILATVVRLICRAYFRAGSERYAVRNRTFGICTLDKRHVTIDGRNLVFTYTGKQRKDHRQVVADTPLVEIIEELMRLPGRRLFQYPAGNGGGSFRAVTAQAVNRYLSDLLSERYTSKDLRTFGGTVRAATILADLGPPRSSAEAKRNTKLAVSLTALELGNTPAICRKAYIHPAVLSEYENAGRTVASPVSPGALHRTSMPEVETVEPVGYYPEELALMRFLEMIHGTHHGSFSV